MKTKTILFAFFFERRKMKSKTIRIADKTKAAGRGQSSILSQ